MVVRNISFKNKVQQDDLLTRRIIACAIEVHKRLGPGLLEKLYKEAMVIELGLNGLKVDKNVKIPVEYQGKPIGEYFIDLWVEDTVILELKSVDRHDPVFEAQILSYMKLTGKKSACSSTLIQRWSKTASSVSSSKSHKKRISKFSVFSVAK